MIAALIVSVVIYRLFGSVPDYMDEVFHIPQATRYCNWDWTWDNKITTPPGLYLVSLLSCSNLRLVNLLFGWATLYLLKKLRPSEYLAIATFPILYFYNYLYYTEAPGTFFVLLAYCLAKNHRALSAIACFAAILCRQTNAVWLLFIAANSLIEYLESRDVLKNPAYHLKLVIRLFFPFALVACLFAAFVVINKGIVLGDRENHVPTVHIAQILYFASFCCFFGCGLLAPVSKRDLIYFIPLCLISFIGIHYFTFSHLNQSGASFFAGRQQALHILYLEQNPKKAHLQICTGTSVCSQPASLSEKLPEHSLRHSLGNFYGPCSNPVAVA